jgi:hypothetical protein
MVRKIKSRKNKIRSSSRKNKKSNKVFRAGSYAISSSKRKSRKVKKSRKKKTILHGGVRKSKLQSSSKFGPKRSKLNKNNINYNLQSGGSSPIENRSILERKGGIKYIYENGAYVPQKDDNIDDRVVQVMETANKDTVLVLFDSGKVEKIRYDDIPVPGGGNTVATSINRKELVKEFLRNLKESLFNNLIASDEKFEPFIRDFFPYNNRNKKLLTSIKVINSDQPIKNIYGKSHFNQTNGKDELKLVYKQNVFKKEEELNMSNLILNTALFSDDLNNLVRAISRPSPTPQQQQPQPPPQQRRRSSDHYVDLGTGSGTGPSSGTDNGTGTSHSSNNSVNYLVAVPGSNIDDVKKKKELEGILLNYKINTAQDFNNFVKQSESRRPQNKDTDLISDIEKATELINEINDESYINRILPDESESRNNIWNPISPINRVNAAVTEEEKRLKNNIRTLKINSIQDIIDQIAIINKASANSKDTERLEALKEILKNPLTKTILPQGEIIPVISPIVKSADDVIVVTREEKYKQKLKQKLIIKYDINDRKSLISQLNRLQKIPKPNQHDEQITDLIEAEKLNIFPDDMKFGFHSQKSNNAATTNDDSSIGNMYGDSSIGNMYDDF